MQQTPIGEDEWILGLPDAPITLLEYGDFECPYCTQARLVLEGLVAENPDALRLVYRHFPITTIHPHGLMAAEAAEAAGAQGKFWAMHDMLYTHQRQLEYEPLRIYATAIGVDEIRFDQELRAHLYLEEVKQDFRRGVKDEVNGTPVIFINRRRYDGPRERESMRAAIAALGMAAGA